MGAARGQSQAARSAAAAAALKARGILHGMRQCKPYPNSGGLSMSWAAGSARYQRLMQRKRR